MLENWSSRDVQENPSGFLRAQEQERTRAERERKEAREQADFEQFRALFIERGGDPSDARSMYRKYRNDKALEEAARLDKRAREEHRTTRSRQV